MEHLNHQSYYLTRAQTSRELAERAADPAIAAIHAELATRYDTLVQQVARNGENKALVQAV